MVDKRSIIVSAILLGIAILFVVGLGGIITGNYALGPNMGVQLKIGESAEVLGHSIKLERISVIEELDRRYGAIVSVDGQMPDVQTDFLKECGKAKVVNQLRLSVPCGGITYPRDPKLGRAMILVSEGIQTPLGNVLTHYPYPFIMNNNYNKLKEVLSNGFSAKEKEAAVLIANSLKGNRRVIPQVVTENEIKETEGMNLILIGKACENEIIAKFMRTNACDLGFLRKDEGYIEYLPQSGTPMSGVLVITGYSEDDILNAATVISNYQYYILESNRVIVKGDLKEGPYGLEIDEIDAVSYRKV